MALPVSTKISLWLVGKVVTCITIVMLMVIATPYFFHKTWNDLTPTELFFLMLIYMVLAGALSALIVFWLRHGIHSAVTSMEA